MNEQVSRKISWISLIVVLGIVIYHSDLCYALSFYRTFSMVYMPWFFMISGYFASRGFSKETMGKRFSKRVYSLLVPYVLWNLIQLFYSLVREHFHLETTFKEVLIGFFFSPACIPSWYFFALFLMVAVFFLLKPLFMGKRKSLVLLALGFVISFAVYSWCAAAIMQLGTAGGFLIKTFMYFPSFLIGATMPEFSEGYIRVKGKTWIPALVLAVVLAVLICLLPGESLLFITCTNLFNAALWRAIPERIFKEGRYGRYLTEPALFVCMSHIMLNEIWQSVFQFPNRMRYSLITVPLAILTSYGLFYLMKRFTPHVLNLLTGGRAGKKK